MGHLGVVHDRSEVVEQAFKRLELLQKFDEVVRPQGVGVFGGNLHHHVEVLADVAGEQIF